MTEKESEGKFRCHNIKQWLFMMSFIAGHQFLIQFNIMFNGDIAYKTSGAVVVMIV
jgi:hypothetical protein